MLEHILAVGGERHGITRRPAEPLQNRRQFQELLYRRRLFGKHFLGEIAGDVTMIAGEGRDQGMWIFASP